MFRSNTHRCGGVRGLLQVAGVDLSGLEDLHFISSSYNSAKANCKSRALGGRGLEDPRSCSSGSARPPSAIFHPLAAPAPDRDFRGWLLSDCGRGGATP